jgi:hypothetical protein
MLNVQSPPIGSRLQGTRINAEKRARDFQLEHMRTEDELRARRENQRYQQESEKQGFDLGVKAYQEDRDRQAKLEQVGLEGALRMDLQDMSSADQADREQFQADRDVYASGVQADRDWRLNQFSQAEQQNKWKQEETKRLEETLSQCDQIGLEQLTPEGQRAYSEIFGKARAVQAQRDNLRPEQYNQMLRKVIGEFKSARLDRKIIKQPSVTEQVGRDIIPIGRDGKVLQSLDGATSVIMRTGTGFKIEQINKDVLKDRNRAKTLEEYIHDDAAFAKVRKEMMDEGDSVTPPSDDKVYQRMMDRHASRSKFLTGLQGGRETGAETELPPLSDEAREAWDRISARREKWPKNMPMSEVDADMKDHQLISAEARKQKEQNVGKVQKPAGVTKAEGIVKDLESAFGDPSRIPPEKRELYASAKRVVDGYRPIPTPPPDATTRPQAAQPQAPGMWSSQPAQSPQAAQPSASGPESLGSPEDRYAAAQSAQEKPGMVKKAEMIVADLTKAFGDRSKMPTDKQALYDAAMKVAQGYKPIPMPPKDAQGAPVAPAGQQVPPQASAPAAATTPTAAPAKRLGKTRPPEIVSALSRLKQLQSQGGLSEADQDEKDALLSQLETYRRMGGQ